MKEQKKYRLFYLAGSKKEYCSQSCDFFVDNQFTPYEKVAGKFSGGVANRLLKQSRLPLQKELVKNDN